MMNAGYNKPTRDDRPATTQAQRDAEYILTTIMHRQNYTSVTRDALADALEKIAAGQTLTPKLTLKRKKYK